MGNNIEKHTIIVEGMSCGHCKNAVEKAVGALPGAISAEVDLVAKTLIVEVDASKTTLDQIKEAVDEIGFTVV
ncbi:MAG: Heavy metal transport/detoxification protein [Firmicutes bacterium]|nr:Heavy metal transport/detoxification protein [Bacillota bacterium]